MTIHRSFVISCSFVLLCPLLTSYSAAQSENKNSSKYACSEPQPEQLCNASNTCGSASSPCTVDVKRTADSASVTPGIPNAKGNSLFCVRTGTTVTWQTTSKNVGFLVDFGDASPFEPPEAITGGSSRSVSVVAKKPGCFKFSAGACASGAIYGMCKETDSEAVVIGAAN